MTSKRWAEIQQRDEERETEENVERNEGKTRTEGGREPGVWGERKGSWKLCVIV